MPHERSMGLRSETGEFFMRAIFINAVDRKVEEIQIENELHAFYERIGCDMIHFGWRSRNILNTGTIIVPMPGLAAKWSNRIRRI